MLLKLVLAGERRGSFLVLLYIVFFLVNLIEASELPCVLFAIACFQISFQIFPSFQWVNIEKF